MLSGRNRHSNDSILAAKSNGDKGIHNKAIFANAARSSLISSDFSLHFEQSSPLEKVLAEIDGATSKRRYP
jgi:hypothetical protein